jgi:putative nucleotidyltransferase with HDIG domain
MLVTPGKQLFINRLPTGKFQIKVTLAFMFSLLFIVCLGILLLYEYSLNSQFNQIRERLLVIVRNAAISVDVDALMRVPLVRQGTNSQEYKLVSGQLDKIKQINPSLEYVYTLTKTDKPGIWKFIVDPNPSVEQENVKWSTAYPGDEYNASRFPEMLQAYQGPTVDSKMTIDEWGVTLSGYAPLYNKEGKVAAILGVDINADRVYAMQKTVKLRAILVLLVGVVISVILGYFISRSVVKPVKILVEGTRRIASGDLGYKVEIKGEDEIKELATSFNDMARSLSESRKQLNDYFYRVVQSMIRSLEAKDPYTRGHSDRVSEYAKKIALEMGYSSEKAELLKEVAQLHDIGKLGVNEAILNKKGTLSESEWDIVHKHPEVGEEILKPIFLDMEMLPVIRSHHERFDGKGYPDGIGGDRINIFAQITSVADAYDAMTSSRAYRSALSMKEAVRRMEKDSGTQFNPRIVGAFIRVLGKDGN